MLAAIVKVSNIMTEEEFLNDMKTSFKHKFAKKPRCYPRKYESFAT